MATHLIVMSVVMEEMDGSPEGSAEILIDPRNNYEILRDYIDGGLVEITAEDISPATKPLDFLNDDGSLL